MSLVDLAEASDPALLDRLSHHPRVGTVREGGGPGVRFVQGAWKRRIAIGEPQLEVAGLAELMDNNPMVCADEISVPDPASTLALIALGPLAQASLITDAPVLQCAVPTDSGTLDAFISRAGWPGGVTIDEQPLDLGGGAAASLFVPIRTPERLEDLDDLYAEAYGRSFYVRRDEDVEWDVRQVLGQPHALFRLRISPGDSQSLLTVQVLADLDGKCGADQVVHAMNIMAGFEETLGLQPRQRAMA